MRDDIGPYFRRGWLELAERHAIVGEARMIGLMGALELVREGRTRFDKDRRAGERCRDLCIEHGVVMRAVGDTMIVAPPLVITHGEIDELLEKADAVLTATARALN